MLTIANELAAMGCEVDFVLAHAEGDFLELLDNRINVIDLKASRLIGYTQKLAGYLKRRRPFSLLSASDECNLAAIWAKKLSFGKTRIVISCHNTLSQYIPNSKYLKARLLLPLSIRASYPMADQVIAVSEGVADDLARVSELARQRITVIHNPVITPRLFDQAKEECVHPWLNDKSVPVILAVGGLRPAKDFSTLLRAFSMLLGRREARLLILGEGRDRQTLQELSGSLGISDRVSMPGFSRNPYPFMRKADVFALSSAWEGFAIVIVEALALGCKVVATDCKSGPREILQDGAFGTLVTVGDAPGLADALLAALDADVDPEKLRRRAMDFSPQQLMYKYRALLFGADE